MKSRPGSGRREARILQERIRNMILPILLGVTVVVAIFLGVLAKMSFKEIILQTGAMLAAAGVFYGLAVLV